MATSQTRPKPVNRLLGKLVDSIHRLVWRVSGGSVGSKLGKYPILLLTTTGRKSGQPRTHALAYFRDSDRLLVIASNGGQPQQPGWYLNLLANPQVAVETQGSKRTMLAHTADAAARSRLWPQIVATAPQYAGYQAATAGIRDIPLVVLAAEEN